MTGNKHQLAIYLAKEKVGTLSFNSDSEQLSLHYDPQWKKQGFALSPHLPLTEKIEAVALNRYLKNLFPEGRGLEVLLESYRISKNNTFGLIKILGEDTASGLSFHLLDKMPDEHYSFRKISNEELTKRLQHRHEQGLVIWDNKPRLSIAGVQDKINVVLDKNGNIGFGEGVLCSTHILKFEQKQQTHLVLNEYIMMTLSKRSGLSTASVELRRYGEYPALLVTRFDRKTGEDGHVLRRYVIDGCQALNLPPEYKYEHNFGSGRDVQHIRDGVSLPNLFELARQANKPVLEIKKLLDHILFNLCINNHDAHGKNFSYFLNAKGLQLTPSYDLVNVAIYPEFEQEMAMALGDEFDPDTVNAYQLADFADSSGISRNLVAIRLKIMIKKIIAEIKTIPLLEVIKTPEERQFANSLLQNVRCRCEQLLKETDNIVGMDL